MLPFFRERFGNASSRTHPFGWDAEEAVAAARKQVAGLLGAKAKEIVFTSGATESDNLALLGYARRHKAAGRHVVVSAIEHKAVLDAATALESEGFEVTRVKPTKDGVVEPMAVEAALRDDTLLVAVMLANNEVGTVQPVEEIGAICAAREIAFVVDAAQGVGRVPFDVERAQVTMAAVSAHKIYGPKGVGALYVRSRPKTKLDPILFGGGHERGLRSGTLNVPGIVGLGAACAILKGEGEAEAARLGGLRDRLLERLREIEGVHVNGRMEGRLSHNLNVAFDGVEAESLILATQHELALSSGSACTTQTLEPSYVLLAMGISHERAHSSIRIGLGRDNRSADVDAAAEVIAAAVRDLR
jgi:cysteine desulfurase